MDLGKDMDSIGYLFVTIDKDNNICIYPSSVSENL